MNRQTAVPPLRHPRIEGGGGSHKRRWHCVSCHDGTGEAKLDLRGTRDNNAVPTSYKTVVNMKLVDHFNTQYGQRQTKAEPKTFGALQSRLIQVLEGGHNKVALDRDEMLAIKTWIAMNCPLWGDYRPPAERLAELQTQANLNKEKVQ